MRGVTRSARINGKRRSNRATALLALGTWAAFAAATATTLAAVATTASATTPTPAVAATLIATALVFAFATWFTREIARTATFTAITATATTTAAMTTLAATAAMAPLPVVTAVGGFRAGAGSGGATTFRGWLVTAKKTLQPAHEATGFLLLDDGSTLRLPRGAGLKLAFIPGIARLTRFTRSPRLITRIRMLARASSIAGIVRPTFTAAFAATLALSVATLTFGTRLAAFAGALATLARSLKRWPLRPIAFGAGGFPADARTLGGFGRKDVKFRFAGGFIVSLGLLAQGRRSIKRRRRIRDGRAWGG